MVMNRAKGAAVRYMLRLQREVTAETIATAIMERVDGAEAFCEDPDCLGRKRYLAAMDCAAVARDIGAGRYRAAEKQPACSPAALAAMGRMAKAVR